MVIGMGMVMNVGMATVSDMKKVDIGKEYAAAVDCDCEVVIVMRMGLGLMVSLDYMIIALSLENMY